MEEEILDLVIRLQPIFKKNEWKAGDRAFHPDCGVGIFHKERVYFNGFSLRSDNQKLLRYPRVGELWQMVDWSKLKTAEMHIDVDGHVYTGNGKWEDLELALLKALSWQEQEKNKHVIVD